MPYANPNDPRKAQARKRYAEKHKEAINERNRAQCKQYYQKHRSHLNTKNTQRQRELALAGNSSYAKRRNALIEAMGGKCVRCGFSDKRALCIDHINGGGTQERNQFGHNTQKYYVFILDNLPSGKYQLLCANCNAIKEYEERERKYA